VNTNGFIVSTLARLLTCVAVSANVPTVVERRERFILHNTTTQLRKLTATKHKVEGFHKGIKPVLAGHPL